MEAADEQQQGGEAHNTTTITTSAAAAASRRFEHRLQVESYIVQRDQWPKFGQFILAQYTDEAILVYQAFKPEIGRYAVAHQRFTGCPGYSTTRMTWIKTNFLWMMFRNGWGKKKNQETTLGIWLKRSAFDRYISVGSKATDEQSDRSIVRLQWDPDHYPNGEPVMNRKALQIGIKNVASFANGEDILRIDDLSPLVAECSCEELSKLFTPKEIIYEPNAPSIRSCLRLSCTDEEPLRLTLCRQGQRKMVVLHPRTMNQLFACIKQKFRVKALSVTGATGQTITQKDLQNLPQDTVLHIS